MSELIALYIDADNVCYKNIEIIIDYIKKYGKIIISKVYGDWSENNLKNWLLVASKYGIIPIQCDRIKKKNSSDIKICVDVIKDLYTIDHITLFYLITNDSDYRHVVSEVKIKNKKINCIGDNTTNISLKSICDIYDNINNLIIDKDTNLRKDNNYTKKKKPLKMEKVEKKNSKDKNDVFIKIYSQEIKNLLINHNSINISLIKDILVSKYNFNLNKLGYTKMSKFINDKFTDKFCIINDRNGISITNKQ